MAGAGNIYCDDYEDVAAQHVWDAVRDAFQTGRHGIGVEAPEMGEASMADFCCRVLGGPRQTQ